MRPTDILLLNLKEVRRRSLIVRQSIPANHTYWRPDAKAKNCIEIIRHVLKAEWTHAQVIRTGKSLDSDDSPFNSKPLIDVQSELEFAEPYRQEFLALIGAFTPSELAENKIDRSDVGYVRTLGDFILRIAYHEAVHAGQLLFYLRMMGSPVSKIWD